MPNYSDLYKPEHILRAFDDPDPYGLAPVRKPQPDQTVPDPPGTDIKDYRRISGAEREKYIRHLIWSASLGLIDDDELEARTDAVTVTNNPAMLLRVTKDLLPLREDDYTPEGMRASAWKNRFQGDPMKRPWRHFAHFLVAVAAVVLALSSAVILSGVKHPAVPLEVFCGAGIAIGALTMVVSTIWWIAWVDYGRAAARRRERDNH